MSSQIYRRAAWRRLRWRFLRANPHCMRCLEDKILTPAVAVHHLEPVARAPHRIYDWENLQALCVSCHSMTEAEFVRGYSNEFGVDGLPVDPRHPIYRQRNVRRARG